MTPKIPIWGHRGARGLFPENTLEGFRAAMALGVRAFELDVGVTADDAVVLSHDLALNPDITRDADGRFLAGPGPLIRSLTLAELLRYDVGRTRRWSRTAMLFPHQRAMDGARISLLADLLALDPGLQLIIELKTDPRHPDWTVAATAMADAVLAVVDAAGARDRVTIESFDWRGPRHLRRLNADIRLAWLTRAETVRDACLWWDVAFRGSVPQAVAAMGGDVWAPEHGDLTQPGLAEAHELGLGVVPWTVNRPADVRRLAGWGVDGLITDYPDAAVQALGTSGGCVENIR